MKYYNSKMNFNIKYIQHCFICRPSDSTVSEDAGIKPRDTSKNSEGGGVRKPFFEENATYFSKKE
jgi:hypothetical protein